MPEHQRGHRLPGAAGTAEHDDAPGARERGPYALFVVAVTVAAAGEDPPTAATVVAAPLVVVADLRERPGPYR
ncbi:MAG: hypothetical protein ACJ72W_11465 [Actinoallomurus sp.]